MNRSQKLLKDIDEQMLKPSDLVQADLKALEKEVKKMKLKDGKIVATEFNDGLGGENLSFTVEWQTKPIKIKREYFIGVRNDFRKKKQMFQLELRNVQEFEPEKPASVAKEMAKMLPNPYDVIASGKVKGKNWMVVRRSDTHPPYQAFADGIMGTDIHKEADLALRSMKTMMELDLKFKKKELDQVQL